jgi:O-antigen ligase
MNAFSEPPNFQGGPARPLGAANGVHLADRGPKDLDWGLAMIAMLYVFYVPVGRYLIYNEYVYGPGGASETLQKIWSAGRYLAAFAVAPALLVACSGARAVMRCWPALPFAFFAIASCIWSAAPKASMLSSLNLFFLLVTVSALVNRYGLAGLGRRAQIVTGLLMIASVATALLVPRLGVHHAYDLTEPVHAGLWRGVFRHKNELGELSALSIVFSLRSLRNETRPWKIFFITASLCAVACLVMAGSANALLAAFFGVTFFLLMRHRATANPIVMALIMLIGVGSVLGLSLKAEQLAVLLGRDPSFSGRTEIWALGREMIQRHLLFGSGFGTDGPVFGELAKGSLFSSAADLHSGYMDVLFNFGVVGSVLMVIAVGAPMVRTYIYTLSHTGEERDQAVIFMSLVVASCALALAEISPFTVLGIGPVGIWTAVPALYQLGVTARDRQLRAAARGAASPSTGVADYRRGPYEPAPDWRLATERRARPVANLAAPVPRDDA